MNARRQAIQRALRRARWPKLYEIVFAGALLWAACGISVFCADLHNCSSAGGALVSAITTPYVCVQVVR